MRWWPHARPAAARAFAAGAHRLATVAAGGDVLAADQLGLAADALRDHAIRSYRAAAPDLRVTIDDMIAEGDKVALRWTTHGTERGPLHTPLGIAPATERPISIPGVNIFRIVNGQIAEEWIIWDTLSWAQQLGFQMRRP